MKYIVYCTTNNVNNKIYVGVHKTEDPNIFDGYIGNGISTSNKHYINNPKEPFHFAVNKYGIDSFTRTIIQIFDNLQEALDLEYNIVNEEFIQRDDTYNVTIGGGYPPISSKTIYQYSLDGAFLNEYSSIVEAAKQFNVQSSCIGHAVLHKHTSNNFLWSDIKVSKLDITEYTVYNPKKVVYQYDCYGNYETCYESINSAAKELGVSISNIQRSIYGNYKTRNHYFSLEFKPQYLVPKNIKHINSPIYQYTLEGVFIREYKNIRDVENQFGCRMDGINSAIRMNRTYKGFQWSREKLDQLNPIKNMPKNRKVGQYTLSGELIKVYDTVRDCRKNFSNVSKVLKGQAQSCKGYTFKYIS